MSLKPVFLYPRYSFLSLGYRFMISKISSMDNPVVREAAFTNRQYFLGASTLIIFMPFLINSGVPELGLAFISAQAQFRTAINGRVSLTLGPSIFLSLVAMGITSIGCGVRFVLLCSFAAGFLDVLRFKFAVSDSFIFVCATSWNIFPPTADCWWLNANRSGRSAHVVFVIGNHICLFQFWDKQNNALFVSFPNSNSKHFILQMQLGLPNSLFLGFCL